MISDLGAPNMAIIEDNKRIIEMQKETRFKEIIHRNKDLLWHVCEDYRLSPAWTTEDAFQEVLCNIWKSMGQYKGQSSERTWVYRIAVNTMLSIKRKLSNNPSPTASASDVEAQRPQELSELERIIASLDEPDKTIVRSSLDGFDYSEIAEITNLTVGAVAMRLSRAKEKIKNILSHE